VLGRFRGDDERETTSRVTSADADPRTTRPVHERHAVRYAHDRLLIDRPFVNRRAFRSRTRTCRPVRGPAAACGSFRDLETPRAKRRARRMSGRVVLSVLNAHAPARHHRQRASRVVSLRNAIRPESSRARLTARNASLLPPETLQNWIAR
jgi:hypothetical protein